MKRVIDFLIPKEDKFFDMLSQQAANALDCRVKFNELITNYEEIEPAKKDELVREIKDLEDKGDHLTHDVIEGLNTTFITPIDKEDIHKLTILLDDMVDGMDEIATILSLYKIEKMTQHMQELAEIAVKRTSTKAILFCCANGNDNRKLPIVVIAANEKNITWLADHCFIRQLFTLRFMHVYHYCFNNHRRMTIGTYLVSNKTVVIWYICIKEFNSRIRLYCFTMNFC